MEQARPEAWIDFDQFCGLVRVFIPTEVDLCNAVPAGGRDELARGFFKRFCGYGLADRASAGFYRELFDVLIGRNGNQIAATCRDGNAIVLAINGFLKQQVLLAFQFIAVMRDVTFVFQ